MATEAGQVTVGSVVERRADLRRPPQRGTVERLFPSAAGPRKGRMRATVRWQGRSGGAGTEHATTDILADSLRVVADGE